MAIDVLDWAWVKADEGWEVWTPDSSGACIGHGASKAAALRDTIRRLRESASALEVCLNVAEWRERRERQERT